MSTNILKYRHGFSLRQIKPGEFHVTTFQGILHDMIYHKFITIWGEVNCEKYYYDTGWIFAYFDPDEYAEATKLTTMPPAENR